MTTHRQRRPFSEDEVLSKAPQPTSEPVADAVDHRRFTPEDLATVLAAGALPNDLELLDGRLHDPASGEPHRFTVDEYLHMAELGIFYDEQVELLAGEILETPRSGHQHIGCVNALTYLLTRDLNDRAVVGIRNLILLSDHSAPKPDLAILASRDDFYRSKIPQPEDALLVIEVADTSYARDRRRKLPLYAAAGVVEVWIVDLGRQRIETHLDPEGSAYRTRAVGDRASTLTPRLLPDLALVGADILG